MALSAYPPVSVITCTRNRAAGIHQAARAILASDYPDFELLVVDESDDAATRDALGSLDRELYDRSEAQRFSAAEPWVGESGTLAPRRAGFPLRHLPLAARGKAHALNHALQHARGEYLALTDDDCEMAPDCLSLIVAAFESNDRIGAVFGNVAAGAHDETLEHVPVRQIEQSETISQAADFLRISTRRSAPWLNFGIGANMAVRTDALRAIGGWDPCIGPGEKFGSGDDHDLAFRILRAGHAVHFCPGARVLHHGARPRSGLRRDYHRFGRGFGAAFVKQLKCGALYHGSARTVPFHLARLCAGSLSGQRSESAAFLGGWVSGFCAGLLCPIDQRTNRFQVTAEKGERPERNSVHAELSVTSSDFSPAREDR